MMIFSGSHSEPIKKWREAAWSHKNTPREKPQGVFGVHYYLVAGVFVAARTRRSRCLARAHRSPSRPSQPMPGSRPSHPSQPAARAPRVRRVRRSRSWYDARGSRGTLVDASVYLKPTKLVDVALDVLARLAPCLNLRVGELGHKDLLDTVGSDNCRK